MPRTPVKYSWDCQKVPVFWLRQGQTGSFQGLQRHIGPFPRALTEYLTDALGSVTEKTPADQAVSSSYDAMRHQRFVRCYRARCSAAGSEREGRVSIMYAPKSHSPIGGCFW